jgi:glyoxylase-like metal-dependent hydrolase (beta-lactamase superfamily II)
MTRWWQRLFAWVVPLAVVAAAAGVIWLRMHRDRFDAPAAVTANVSRVRNLFVDFYAARAGAHVLLFDAGVDLDGKAVDALLGQLHARREDVSHVFITHGHSDHLAAVPLFPNAKVHASSRDVDMMRDKSLLEPALAIVAGWALPVPYVSATALGDEGVVPVDGGGSVRVFPLPGHTSGSTAYLFDGVLFVGDSMRLGEGKLAPAPPLFSVDRAENRRSIAALKTALAGLKLDVICTGHQGCTGPGQAGQLLDELVASP